MLSQSCDHSKCLYRNRSGQCNTEPFPGIQLFLTLPDLYAHMLCQQPEIMGVYLHPFTDEICGNSFILCEMEDVTFILSNSVILSLLPDSWKQMSPYLSGLASDKFFFFSSSLPSRIAQLEQVGRGQSCQQPVHRSHHAGVRGGAAYGFYPGAQACAQRCG